MFILSKTRENVSFNNGRRMCALLGREMRKLLCGLQTIAHSNKIQEERMSTDYGQKHVNI